MSIRTTTVTLAAKCDGPNCYREVTASGSNAAAARQGIRWHGWATVGTDRAYCRPCANDRARLIAAGVLSKSGGHVLNLPAYDAFLDQRAKVERL